MLFHSQHRHSVGITRNDYFRADFPLKTQFYMHTV